MGSADARMRPLESDLSTMVTQVVSDLAVPPENC